MDHGLRFLQCVLKFEEDKINILFDVLMIDLAFSH